MLCDDVVGQTLQRLALSAAGMDFEVTETHERRRYPTNDRPWLGPRVAAVEHVPNHHIAGGDEAQCARCGNTQEVHGFTAEELANGGAKDCSTIGCAGIRCRPSSLQLK